MPDITDNMQTTATKAPRVVTKKTGTGDSALLSQLRGAVGRAGAYTVLAALRAA